MSQQERMYWYVCSPPSILVCSLVPKCDVEGEKAMGIAEDAMRLVEVDGENASIVERLKEPLRRALGGRRCFYSVHVESVNRVGEVLVSITGHRGRLPLLFASDELEPGYVFGVVSHTIDRFGF
jgi:hypothetical protein